MHRALLLAGLTAVPWSSLQAQDACGTHYRWNQKIEETYVSMTPKKAYITTMLRSWALLSFTSQALYHCIGRQGRELETYSLTGWARRVRRDEDDGDWHIEVTARQNSPTDSCIVVEIPPGGGNFLQARHDFNTLVGFIEYRR